MGLLDNALDEENSGYVTAWQYYYSKVNDPIAQRGYALLAHKQILPMLRAMTAQVIQGLPIFEPHLRPATPVRAAKHVIMAK